MTTPIRDQLRGSLRRLIFATLAAALVVPAGVHAGDHWLSRVTVETIGPLDTMVSARLAAPAGIESLAAASSQAVFDITISLDTNPQGDDDWTVDDGTDDDEQNAYEERIKEYANAVYQSTNGAHKIGKVTIFREGDQATSSDVIWTDNCPADEGPRANPSGFGVTGKHIWMCTNWSGASTLMSDPKGSGYTLAHEWGHYAYGLYDEYAQDQCDDPDDKCIEFIPLGTDTAAIPAIMNNQWAAAQGDPDYLEFSTQNIHPYREDSEGTNAHKRVFDESAWETLTRDAASDPKFDWLPDRTHYSSLTAPIDPNWLVNDDESTAQSELDIRWVGNQVMDLLLDRSGSMAGTPLDNAKTGANLLIDQVQAGTALGISSFATDVRRDFAITDIPEPDTGVKESAKAAVNALVASGLTAMYDGLMFSLSGVQAFDPNRPGLVYVLSDGLDNASTQTESSVITAYQAAGVPIIAFAYGSFAPTGTLLNMANATGGAFYQSPTTLAEIQAVLVAAEAKFSSNVLISSVELAAAASSVTTRTIPIDSTLGSVRINLSYNGGETDFIFTLLLPDGTASGVPFVCEGATSCSATLGEPFFDSFGYGDYQVEMINTTSIDKDVTILASATPSGAVSYDIAVGFSSSIVNYPADMALRATVTKGPAIAGLAVVAAVNDPTGNTFELPLLDDGEGADRIPNDGTYTASIPYMASGVYSAVVTASNSAGDGQTTFGGLSVSLREDGTAYIPTPTEVTENFIRVGTSSASAVGVLSDDHGDDPSGGTCTEIADNNFDTAGRIDFSGDTDCFTFVPSSTSDPIVVRVTSLTLGMDPLLTVYDSGGVVPIVQVDLSTSQSPSTGVTVSVAAADIDPAGLIFVVQHVDPGASTGGYKVSAGLALTSDAPPDADEDGVQDDADACPDSDLSPNIVIDGCDSGVINHLQIDGCTINDGVAECIQDASNHGGFVSCVTDLTSELKASGIITGSEKGAIQKCAARAELP